MYTIKANIVLVLGIIASFALWYFVATYMSALGKANDIDLAVAVEKERNKDAFIVAKEATDSLKLQEEEIYEYSNVIDTNCSDCTVISL